MQNYYHCLALHILVFVSPQCVEVITLEMLVVGGNLEFGFQFSANLSGMKQDDAQ